MRQAGLPHSEWDKQDCLISPTVVICPKMSFFGFWQVWTDFNDILAPQKTGVHWVPLLGVFAIWTRYPKWDNPVCLILLTCLASPKVLFLGYWQVWMTCWLFLAQKHQGVHLVPLLVFSIILTKYLNETVLSVSFDPVVLYDQTYQLWAFCVLWVSAGLFWQ